MFDRFSTNVRYVLCKFSVSLCRFKLLTCLFMEIISDIKRFLYMGSSSNTSTLSHANSWLLSLWSVITECWEVFLRMWLRCSAIRVFRSLLVCPRYEALQSLQEILYTTLFRMSLGNLSFCTRMNCLSLFIHVYDSLVCKSRTTGLNCSEKVGT